MIPAWSRHLYPDREGLLSFELIDSEEYLFSDDGLILSLQESFAPGIGTKLIDWLIQHGDNLKPPA